MLDDGGQKTDDSQKYETQAKDHGGVDLFRGPFHHTSPQKDIFVFGNAKAKPDEREGGTNPSHQSAVCGLPGAFLGKFAGDISCGGRLASIHKKIALF